MTVILTLNVKLDTAVSFFEIVAWFVLGLTLLARGFVHTADSTFRATVARMSIFHLVSVQEFFMNQIPLLRRCVSVSFPGLAALVVCCLPAQTFSQDVDSHEDVVVTAVRVETLADNIDGGSGGIAIDKQGNVYTADFGSRLGRGGKGGDKVFRISPEGEVSLFCKGLQGASGNAFDADGNLFQSNIGGNLISKITPDGKISVFSREGLVNPVGIVIDSKGTLFVANCGNGTIRKIPNEGVSTEFVKSKLLKCPNGITIDNTGNLYTANFYNGDVLKITPDGKVMYINEVAPVSGSPQILAPKSVRRIVLSIGK